MSKNKSKIKIEKKEIHELPKGHKPHRSGAGYHDNRPRKERTRKDINDKEIERNS